MRPGQWTDRFESSVAALVPHGRRSHLPHEKPLFETNTGSRLALLWRTAGTLETTRCLCRLGLRSSLCPRALLVFAWNPD
ncbi:hypothetical protein PI125_g14201 [Phytophthora idaei]|nr:hypothetical protein PI125_g14201 [Phytophthora idaei]